MENATAVLPIGLGVILSLVMAIGMARDVCARDVLD
jgi:hypothetical protein